MLQLCLAILTSSIFSLIIRYSEGRIRTHMGMIFINYFVCASMSALFAGQDFLQGAGEGLRTALLLGFAAGLFYVANITLLQTNIRRNGVVLAATFMKLGVVISTLTAVLLFKEQPRIWQYVGLVLAVSAILLIHSDKSGGEAPAGLRILLVTQTVVAGLTDSMANIFDKVSDSRFKGSYLFMTFGVAGTVAFLLFLREKKGLCLKDILFGLCLGVPNYFSSHLLLAALHSLPAVIVFPVFSVGTLVVITLAGILFFREKLSRRKLTAIGVIVAALVLLNLK